MAPCKLRTSRTALKITYSNRETMRRSTDSLPCPHQLSLSVAFSWFCASSLSAPACALRSSLQNPSHLSLCLQLAPTADGPGYNNFGWQLCDMFQLLLVLCYRSLLTIDTFARPGVKAATAAYTASPPYPRRDVMFLSSTVKSLHLQLTSKFPSELCRAHVHTFIKCINPSTALFQLSCLVTFVCVNAVVIDSTRFLIMFIFLSTRFPTTDPLFPTP